MVATRRYRRCHLEAVGVQRQCSAQRATEYRILDLPAGGGPYVRERAAAARWNIRGVCLVAQGRPVAIAPRVVLADEHEVVPSLWGESPDGPALKGTRARGRRRIRHEDAVVYKIVECGADAEAGVGPIADL